MVTVDLAALLERLSPCCRQALEEAGNLCIVQRGAEVTVTHLLTAFLGQPACDVRVTLSHSGVPVDDLRQALASAIDDRDSGHGRYPSFSPLLVDALQDAWLLSSVELGQAQIRSGAIFLAALLSPARYLPLATIRLLDGVNREALRKHFATLLATSAESQDATNESSPSAAKTTEDSALARFGHDFTAQARDGRIDPVLCRDAEIDLMIDILSRRRKNNPIVVGDAGVGKSAVVEGLALRIVQGRVPEHLRTVELWGLDLGALQAGASVKGEFEKRLKAVIDEVRNAARPIILFIDEAHTLIGAGNVAGGSDAANLLKPALARGELRTIAATTWSEYKKYFEKDPALTRRFQLVKLEEPAPEQAVHILRGLRPVYEASHQVFIADDALRAAATLASRYLCGRQLPDKAIDVLDTACARVASTLAEPPRQLCALENERRQIDAEFTQLERDGRAGRVVASSRLDALAVSREGVEHDIERLRETWQRQKALVDEIIALRACNDDEDVSRTLTDKVAQLSELQRTGALVHADVGAEQVAQVIADWTGIPATTINSDQMARLDSLPTNLRTRVKGQGAALETVYRRLLTALADLRRPGTPMGVFLLVGPSGVGKTETALAVAESLFGGEQFLTTINMSEYQEKFTVSRLLGAPPGYVGYGEGGVLTEAIRRQPYSVVLLDEVEKAHPEVLDLFYQAFDKGELNDGEGRRIDCRNVLFFLTSNLGFDQNDDLLNDLDGDALRQHLMGFFKPALLARMQIVPYRYLDEEVLDEIIDGRLQRLQQQLEQRHEATLAIADAARHELRARCARHRNGARMLDASIDGELLPPLSLAVLQWLSRGDRIRHAELDWNGDAFTATLT
ncbi:type VI secretion system ATPase TssH [Pseudomonas japonica]|uniref:Type VI secretion system protein VasG n=1 Tax=Pseudomonas japonica TaxID=256466 RepID=A0A239CM66_9PSED|nr:type VI secretion system ATPase TssH [Pseudomonas japonica]SNS21029.1 type VI secretion system protein VasG [Pseudomonas japonica]